MRLELVIECAKYTHIVDHPLSPEKQESGILPVLEIKWLGATRMSHSVNNIISLYFCIKGSPLDNYYKKIWPLRRGEEIKIHQKIPAYFKNNLFSNTWCFLNLWEAPFTCCNVNIKFYLMCFFSMRTSCLVPFLLSIQWICILNIYYAPGTRDIKMHKMFPYDTCTFMDIIVS